MKKLVLTAAFLLLGSNLLAAAEAGRALVAVNRPEGDTAARLVDRGIMVVRDMERYLLVAATADDLGVLGEMGASWETLDPSMTGKSYYTVVLGNEARLPLLESIAPVLRADRFDAVIEIPEERIGEVLSAGFEVARVFVRPIRIARRVERVEARKTRVADPVIQTMVDAVSIDTFSAHVQRLQDFVTRQANTDSCQAAANWIKAMYESYGIDSVDFHHFSSTYKDNVVAVIPGVGDPSKIVLVGGHYDSYTGNANNAPGADDNATGASCALECARVMSGNQFSYTLVFMAFGGEEYGLYGSEGYASDAAARGDDILGAVCVDMIGYKAAGDLLDLDIISNAPSQWMRDLAVQAAADYVPSFSVVDGSLPGGASSDHASFWANGYDAILFFEDTDQYTPYIHTTNDIVGLSYNTPSLAEQSIQTAVGLLATMAEPFRIAIIHTPLDDTEETQNPYRVVAEILSADSLEPDSLVVRYSTGGPFAEAPLTPTGNPNEYEGFIPAQSGGTWVDYYLSAGDVSGYTATDPKNAPAEVYTFFVGAITTVWADDFESDSGWTVGAVDDDATTGIWERCDPQPTEAQPADDHTPDPGVLAYITRCAAGVSQGTYDVDGGKTTLTSPVIDVSGQESASVRYWLWYSNDTGSSPGTDYWLAQVSDDGGSSWVTLDSTYASSRPWAEVEHDLGLYVGLTSQVRLRFVASDYGSGSIVEAGVDDFSIISYQTVSTGTPEAAPGAIDRVVLGANVPNPFNPATEIRFSVPEPGRKVSLKVYDLSGRAVRTLLEQGSFAGPGSAVWNGTDDDGREVSSGVYFYRLEAGRESFAKKLVLIR